MKRRILPACALMLLVLFWHIPSMANSATLDETSPCTVSSEDDLLHHLNLANDDPALFFQEFPECKNDNDMPLILISGTINLRSPITVDGIHLRGHAQGSQHLQENLVFEAGDTLAGMITLSGSGSILDSLNIESGEYPAVHVPSGANAVLFHNRINGGAGVMLYSESTRLLANDITSFQHYAVAFSDDFSHSKSTAVRKCNALSTENNYATPDGDGASYPCDHPMMQGSIAQCKSHFGNNFLEFVSTRNECEWATTVAKLDFNLPELPSPDDLPSDDNDSNPITDSDGDGVANDEDSCPEVYNPSQNEADCVDDESPEDDENAADDDLDIFGNPQITKPTGSADDDTPDDNAGESSVVENLTPPTGGGGSCSLKPTRTLYRQIK